jgi:ABC-type nitrate/sulfonate/bicarbonate transport system ATPase subunit
VSDVGVHGVSFRRDGRSVLEIETLRFPSRSMTAVLGPNGAGKTTLLRLIAGLERPSRGDITIGGEPLRNDRAPRTALALSEPVFIRGTVRRNLDLGLSLRNLPAEERDIRIRDAAEECGITDLLERPARQLSSGEAQRVNLARALALRAEVILLDEPLAAVDRLNRRALLDDLPRLLRSAGATVILVTHDREEAFRLGERLVVLVKGQVRAEGARRDLLLRPPDADTALLLGFLLLEDAEGPVAVAPGDLRAGPGAGGRHVGFMLQVTDVLDLGRQRLVTGTIGGKPVELTLPEKAPSPEKGAMFPVHARSVVRLGAR